MMSVRPALLLLIARPHFAQACTQANVDRWAGGGACCAGLLEVEEPRAVTDPFYCPDAQPQHATLELSLALRNSNNSKNSGNEVTMD